MVIVFSSKQRAITSRYPPEAKLAAALPSRAHADVPAAHTTLGSYWQRQRLWHYKGVASFALAAWAAECTLAGAAAGCRVFGTDAVLTTAQPLNRAGRKISGSGNEHENTALRTHAVTRVRMLSVLLRPLLSAILLHHSCSIEDWTFNTLIACPLPVITSIDIRAALMMITPTWPQTATASPQAAPAAAVGKDLHLDPAGFSGRPGYQNWLADAVGAVADPLASALGVGSAQEQ
jgi:hypothetical protein